MLLPCGNPPHKNLTDIQSGEANSDLRLQLLGLALDGLEPELKARVVINTLELQKASRSYTLETLKILRSQSEYKNKHLLWLIGMDGLVSLDSWYRWRELFNFTSFVVTDRPGYAQPTTGLVAEEFAEREIPPEQLRQYKHGKFCFLNIEALPISSSEIKKQLANRNAVGGTLIESALPANVLQYIYEKNFYTNKNSL